MRVEFMDRLDEFRRLKDISRSELAQKMGVTEKYINKLFEQDNCPHAETLAMICKALKYPFPEPALFRPRKGE